jgi:hypothetical protein
VARPKSAIAEIEHSTKTQSRADSVTCDGTERAFINGKKDNMTLRIERSSDDRDAVLRLIGRIRSEHLEELKSQMGGVEPPVALDLECVTLVDLEVIRFLATCEAAGIEVLHCSPYIREWMRREQESK